MPGMKLFFLIPLFLLFFGDPLLKAQTIQQLTLELKEKAIPLSVSAGQDQFVDLIFFKDILKDKHIIGAGEATHGSAEFFVFKHRFFEFLVTELGARTFALEESYATGLLVNDYIHGKADSSAEQITSHLSLLWNTHEMKDLIQWMKSYNDKHTEKLSFFGFDLHAPNLAVNLLIGYLRKVDSSAVSIVKRQLSAFEDNAILSHRCEKSTYQANQQKLDSVSKFLEAGKKSFVSRSGLDEWLQMRHLVLVLAECAETYRSGTSDFFCRDPYMAANIQWIDSFQTQSRPVMVWAHNSHIQTETRKPNMGSRLKKVYKDKYYALGFFFNQGTYTATSVKSYRERYTLTFSLPESADGSIAHILKQANLKSAFLDFSPGKLSTSAYAWLLGNQQIWEVGYRGFSTGHKLLFQSYRLSQLYDGMVYFETVHNSSNYRLLMKPKN
jgi:erythromycin esterase